MLFVSWRQRRRRRHNDRTPWRRCWSQHSPSQTAFLTSQRVSLCHDYIWTYHSSRHFSLNRKLNSFNSGCDSETDTEEFEKVGQSSIERRSGAAATVPPTTVSISTSTDVIETQSIETLTEVRIHPHHPNLFQSISNPPKKPPRIKVPGKSNEILLPCIPERSGQPAVNELLGTTTNRSTPTNDIYPYYDEQHMIDAPEFVNSEFYIDESLPSSLNDIAHDVRVHSSINRCCSCNSSDDIEPIDAAPVGHQQPENAIVVLLQVHLFDVPHKQHSDEKLYPVYRGYDFVGFQF